MHVHKQSFQVALDADIVRRASGLTADLDKTIEHLLASFIETEESKAASDKRLVEQWITNSNAFIDEHGSPADEHNPFA